MECPNIINASLCHESGLPIEREVGQALLRLCLMLIAMKQSSVYHSRANIYECSLHVYARLCVLSFCQKVMLPLH